MFLNCHTGFSFKYGTLPPRQLFEEARRCSVHKLIVTEINNTGSYMELLRICSAEENKGTHRLEIGVGIEFRKENHLLYIAIAKNNKGFEALNRFLSYHNQESLPIPNRAPAFEDVFIVHPFGGVEPFDLRPNEYIGVKKHQLSQYAVYEHRKEYSHKFTLLHPVTFLPHFFSERET